MMKVSSPHFFYHIPADFGPIMTDSTTHGLLMLNRNERVCAEGLQGHDAEIPM